MSGPHAVDATRPIEARHFGADRPGAAAPDALAPDVDSGMPRTWHYSVDQTSSAVATGSGPVPLTSQSPDTVLVDLPGIRVTPAGVHTPNGSISLDQARIAFVDGSTTVRSTPGYAIALAVVGFFFLTIFSLLFLLIKENRTTGSVSVIVSGPGLAYTSSIPVRSPAQVHDIASRAAYAQQLTDRGGNAGS